jgi:hypothetical protein
MGISIAGSVPKTKKRITRAPAPPISASVITLGPFESPPEDASSSGSWPVTFAVTPGSSPDRAAARVSSPMPYGGRSPLPKV